MGRSKKSGLRYANNEMKYDVVIVVPIYKEELSTFEVISITQLFRVLNGYHISFVMPSSLCEDMIDLILDKPCDYGIERFSDNYFRSTCDYSRLCLSEEFYKRFSDYEYMLIYQTDAFVFSDRLSEFVGMGFDYIGAAMKNEHWKDFHIGNGGLSLRRIESTLSVVRAKDYILKEVESIELFRAYEDLFFGYCAYRKDVNYTAPSIEIANRFSIEDDHSCGFREINKNGLPFGTHRWFSWAYEFWKPVIESFGYTLPNLHKYPDMFELERYERFYAYIPEFFYKANETIQDDFIDYIGLNKSKKYAIWGRGYYGRDCLHILKRIGINIECIFDNSAKQNETLDGISVIHPSASNINMVDSIVLAVYGKETEIIDQIDRLLIKPSDILSWFNLYCDIEDFISDQEPHIEGITIPYEIAIPGGVNGYEIKYPYKEKMRTYKAFNWR